MSAVFYPEILNDIKSVLLKSKRETDICGWYEYESRIGIIFTDIDSIETQEAREAIASKIRRNLSENIPQQIMDELLVDFHFYPEEHDDYSKNINHFEKILYPDIHLDNQTKRYGYFFKRVIDIIGSSLAILLLSPVLCIISLLIMSTSKGPVLFRQERLGQFGKKFIFLKFRSMHVNSDDAIHREYTKKLITENKATEENSDGVHAPLYKIRNDPRITPIGEFLRKTSLDELPQLLNVFRVIAFSSRAGFIVWLRSSTSTKTGRAPEYVIASAVAMKVLGTVMTSSPGPMPRLRRVIHKAEVPLLVPAAYPQSQKIANSFSKLSTKGPPTKEALLKTSSREVSISLRIVAYCALRSRNGTVFTLKFSFVRHRICETAEHYQPICRYYLVRLPLNTFPVILQCVSISTRFTL
jgi:lipopolysaccharide/colanic/teichoic acid biosynthesis glycosyltransferase